MGFPYRRYTVVTRYSYDPFTPDEFDLECQSLVELGYVPCGGITVFTTTESSHGIEYEYYRYVQSFFYPETAEAYYDVHLDSAGKRAGVVQKLIRRLMGWTLEESMEFLNASPALLLEGLPEKAAKTVETILKGAGANVSLVHCGDLDEDMCFAIYASASQFEETPRQNACIKALNKAAELGSLNLRADLDRLRNEFVSVSSSEPFSKLLLAQVDSKSAADLVASQLDDHSIFRIEIKQLK